MSRIICLLQQIPYWGIALEEESFKDSKLDTKHLDTMLRILQAMLARCLVIKCKSKFQIAIDNIVFAEFGVDRQRDWEFKQEFLAHMLEVSPSEEEYNKGEYSTSTWCDILFNHADPDHRAFSNTFLAVSEILTIASKPQIDNLTDTEMEKYISFLPALPIWRVEEEMN